MLNERKYIIALVGDSPKMSEWKNNLIVALDALRGKYPDDSLEIQFTQTINPSVVPFVPVGSLGAQTVDLILCREQLLAANADITVVIDSGIDNETLEGHINQMAKVTKTMVIWCPLDDERTFLPNKKSEIGGLPGRIYLSCSLQILVSSLYFLCISDEIVTFHEE